MAQEMKDSGIMWVGKIPANWNIRRNKTLFSCSKEIVGEQSISMQLLSLTTQGIRKKSKTDVSGKVPESYNTYQIVKPDDIVMCLFDLDCSAVFSGISYYSGMISPAYKVIRCKETILPAYANYWFKYVFADRKYMSYAKNLRFTLSYDEFSAISSVVPPIPEQSAIVSYLDAQCAEIDAVLDKTRTSIEEYKKLKQAIITQAVTKGIRGDRPMKESGVIWLDTVPAEWTISKIKYTIFPKEKPVLPMDEVITCFRDGTVTLRRNRREEGFTISFTENGYQGVDVGDLVIHGMDTFAGAIGCSDSRGKTSPVVHVCSTVGNNRYFMYFLRYMAYSGVLMDFSNGVRIRSSDFRNFKKLAVFEMLVPPLREQNKIVDYLDSTLAKIDQVIKQKEILISELEACKKSAIYEYVTGKKEVPNAY